MKIAIMLFLAFSACAPLVFSAPQAYFSPGGGVQNKIINRIEASFESVDVMCFNFTSRPLARSLLRAQKRGVRVRILLDMSQTEESKSMYGFFKENQMPVKRLSSPDEGIMHNKVAVFDSKIVLTGSYNWTTSAERFNYENALFLDDAGTVFEYQKEFNRLWEMAK